MKEIPTGGKARFGRFGLKPVLTALSILLAVSLFINTQLCYAISVNGETVGTARDLAAASELVSNAEQQASEILGYDYSLEDQVSVSAWLGSGSSAEESDILDCLDDLTKLNVLYIDGKAVAAAEDAAELGDVLEAALARFRTEQTVSASFKQSVFIHSAFADRDILQDMKELLRLTDPAGDSDCRLDVETTDYAEFTRAIPYETESYEDDTVYEGETVVVTEGVYGEALVTERRTLLNGSLTESEEISSTVTREPVTEVVAVGTKEKPPTASTGEYAWPCAGVITSLYGYRSVRVGSSFHKGLDIASGYGTEIYAADGGEVTFAGVLSGYGNLVQITHDNGDVTYYGHCSSLAVSVGERVAQGQLVAYMGASGVASGTHLHFEVRPGGGEPADPLGYLPEDGTREYYL